MRSHPLQYVPLRSRSEERLTAHAVAGHGASTVPVSCPRHHSSCIRRSLGDGAPAGHSPVATGAGVRSGGARDSRRHPGGKAVQLAARNMQHAAALAARQHLSSHPA